MDPALQEYIEGHHPGILLEAIVRLADSAVVPADVKIVSRFGDIATCRIPSVRITEVWGHAAVRSLKAPRALVGEPSGSYATQSNAATVRTRRHHSQLRGRGVTIGIIDWGFDFTHPNFIDPRSGNTRFVAIWDQAAPFHPSAGKYGYGRVYSRAEINRALRSPAPFQSLGYYPQLADTECNGTHGTHVADIAAGNGRVGEPGVAPEADLIGVHLSTGMLTSRSNLGDSVRILEAVDFLDKQCPGRPLVINLSVGSHGGAHDGMSPVEQGFDQFLQSRPGRAIINSAGNYFLADAHMSGRLIPEERTVLPWEIAAGDPTDNELEVWYNGMDIFDCSVQWAGDAEVGAISSLGTKADILHQGRIVGRIYHREQEPNTGKNHIDIFLYKQAPPGQWEVTLRGVRIVDGRFHAWIERDAACGPCQSRFSTGNADRRYTTGSICNGLYTIAVGAYDPRSKRPLAAPYSSAGPTVDGRLKPDLLAPGVGIRAARSTGRCRAQPNGLLTRKSGTSMAAPHVSGAVALLFEGAGTLLSIVATRHALLSSLRPLPSGSSGVADQHGRGVLDINRLLRPLAIPGSKRKAKSVLPALTHLTLPIMKAENSSLVPGYEREVTSQHYTPGASYEAEIIIHQPFVPAYGLTRPVSLEENRQTCECLACTAALIETHQGQHRNCPACGYFLSETERKPSSYTRWLQQSLHDLLPVAPPVSGHMDNDTRIAVRDFQRRQGLPQTGMPDSRTERRLLESRALLQSPANASALTLDSTQHIIREAEHRLIDFTEQVPQQDCMNRVTDETRRPAYDYTARRADRRDPRLVKALVLHHMAFLREKQTAAAHKCVNAHFIILRDGAIYQLHPISAHLWASHGWNPRSVAVEFAGYFRNEKKSGGTDIPTQAQYDAGRFLVKYLVHTLGIDKVLTHRQSSVKAGDPGPDIWYHVGEWSMQHLGISDTTQATHGSGAAIPLAWRTWGQRANVGASPQKSVRTDNFSETMAAAYAARPAGSESVAKLQQMAASLQSLKNQFRQRRWQGGGPRPENAVFAPVSKAGVGSDFNRLIADLSDLEAAAQRDGFTFDQRLSAMRKIFYDSSSWDIVIPAAASTKWPVSWTTRTDLKAKIANVKALKRVSIWNKDVDISHLFAGLDAGNLPVRPLRLTFAGIPLVSLSNNRWQATVAGDLGSVVYEYQQKHAKRPFREAAMKKDSAVLSAVYRQFADDSDMAGNVDAYAITLDKSKTISENIYRYYSWDPPFGSHIRYAAFLSQAIGQQTAQQFHKQLMDDVFSAAQTYAVGQKGDKAYVIRHFQNPGPGLVTPTFWEAAWNATDWTVDLFYDKLIGELDSYLKLSGLNAP